MATAAVLAPHDVPTTLNYYTPIGDEKPYNYVYEPPSGVQPSNVGTDVQPVVVHDARGQEESLSLDTSGFQFVKHVSAEKEFVDEEAIKAKYYEEVEELLKKETGAKRIFIFDHTIRRKSQDPDNRTAETRRDPNARGPVERVHIDQTFEASVQRVHHHLGDEADALLSTRYQIINVWRPIKTILKDPLTVADAHSVPDSDLVGVALIYPDRQGETYTVKPNPDHQWYYLYGQTPEEVMLIKCFDSKLDGRARRVPHTAFVNPDTVDEYARESIEVRCLVFHEDQPAE